jgi:Tfp pilus assembly PilM family ATPase
MKGIEFMRPPSLYLEIGQSSFKALLGDAGLELPLERQENGRVTASCKEKLALGLGGFLQQHRRGSGSRAFCAIGARGVSLRRLMLPPANKEELQRLLRLQLESQFPLPPEDLAWGYYPLSQNASTPNGATPAQELVVAAVKKEVLEEYSGLLTGCALEPVFTLGALARSSLCAQPPPSYAVLDIGRSHCELAVFDQGAPTAIRILPWGGEALTNTIALDLAISQREAEELKLRFNGGALAPAEIGQQVRQAMHKELDRLAEAIRNNWTGNKLYLSGKSACLKDLAPALAQRLGVGLECEPLVLSQAEGCSAAILGLQRLVERDLGRPPLTLQIHDGALGVERPAQPAWWNWAALAGALVLGLLLLPYAEALVRKPALSRKLGEIKSGRDRLGMIDRELGFLEYLRKNQPPYLDILTILAQAAPAGLRIESLALNRRGELSLRASLRNQQQAVEFRSRLIAAGFFSTVVVEEQTPSPDRQKVTIRLLAQWNPAQARESAARAVARPEETQYKSADTQPTADAASAQGLPSTDAPRIAPAPGDTNRLPHAKTD